MFHKKNMSKNRLGTTLLLFWLVSESEVALTVAGSSQHLSRLIQLKLQTMSNIWSWNYTTEKREIVEVFMSDQTENWATFSVYLYRHFQPLWLLLVLTGADVFFEPADLTILPSTS